MTMTQPNPIIYEPRNVVVRREMFRMADANSIRLRSPHHPMTYNNHSVLRPGEYWHWVADMQPEFEHPELAFGPLIDKVEELYPNHAIVVIPNGRHMLNIFIAAWRSQPGADHIYSPFSD